MIKHKWIICTIIAFALIFGGFLIGKRAYYKPIAESIKTDTLTIVDTIRIERFSEVTRTIRDTILIPIPEMQTIIINDTTYLPMPEEQLVIKDSLFTAQIAGVQPRLEWIEIYQQTQTITNTITKVQKVPSRFGLGIQAGYGISKQGLSPYLGVGVSYNLISF